MPGGGASRETQALFPLPTSHGAGRLSLPRVGGPASGSPAGISVLHILGSRDTYWGGFQVADAGEGPGSVASEPPPAAEATAGTFAAARPTTSRATEAKCTR